MNEGEEFKYARGLGYTVIPLSGYLAEQTKYPQITLPVWTNKLCTTSLRRKDSIFYANRLVTSMYWVVKWATLRKPKLIRIGPQGAHLQEGPNERPQPTWTIKESPTNEDLVLFRWNLDESPQKGQSTTSLPSIKASPSTWKKARWICPNSKPIKGTWNHAKDPSPSISYMKGSESIQIAQKMTAIKRPKPI